MPPIDFTRRTALYRFFDQEERLLYVGVAFDPEARWKDHATFKPWWPLVARRVVEWHDSRTEALIAEAETIRAERPLHNIKGSDLPRVGARPQPAAPRAERLDMPTTEARVRVSNGDWATYGDRCRGKGIGRPTDLRLYIKREVASFRRKQKAEAADAG